MALAGGTDLVLLGHHRRDQAETFLLQALRSGGVAALSAMPKSVRRDGITWARPWLDAPAADIEAHAHRHRLRWIDDDSNTDTRFARNRLRAEVWPAMLQAFPDAERSLATAARRAQLAAAAVAETAALDLSSVASEEGLRVAPWRTLSSARRSHALRAWLARCAAVAWPGSLIDRLELELTGTATRRWPAPGGELSSYRGTLRWRAALASSPIDGSLRCDLSRPGRHDCPSWHGEWRVRRVDRGGIADAVAASITIRPRKPGDRFQAGPGRPLRSLKLQFQAAGVAEAERRGPVACIEDRVVFVAGLGIDARAMAEPGEPQLELTWLSRPAVPRADKGPR